MIKKIKLFFGFLFILSLSEILFSKDVILDATSQVKQTKFVIKSGEIIFVEKYQNVNGKVTESFSVNNILVSKDEFLKKFSTAQEEEKKLQKEIAENKKQEEENKNQELALRKKKEAEEFRTSSQIQVLKKLIGIELDRVQNCFLNLDKYKLDESFVFEQDTFGSVQNLQEMRVDLINQAKELTIRSNDQLKTEELKKVLEQLEVVPDKVERFFRNSVKFAINQCTDTKRLKELLALI